MWNDDNCRKTERTYLLSLHEKESQMFATLYPRGRIESAVILSHSKSFFACGLGGKTFENSRKRQGNIRPIRFCFCSGKPKSNPRHSNKAPATSGRLFRARHRARNIPRTESNLVIRKEVAGREN